jgi:hypothetical protein
LVKNIGSEENLDIDLENKAEQEINKSDKEEMRPSQFLKNNCFDLMFIS